MGNIDAVIDPLLIRFRDEVCLNRELVEAMEDVDWFGMSLGWFLANGCDFETAHGLALDARYVHEYWTNN